MTRILYVTNNVVKKKKKQQYAGNVHKDLTG